MNNRYLCRAKRKNCRGLPKEKWWVEGCYAYMQPYHYIMPKDNFDSWIEIDEKTLCACTGLKDKNGKLIWENDILVGYLDDMYPENATYAQVIWDKNGFYTKEQYSDDISLMDEFDEKHFEVCGNIFDNPELLEVGE